MNDPTRLGRVLHQWAEAHHHLAEALAADEAMRRAEDLVRAHEDSHGLALDHARLKELMGGAPR